MEQRTCALCAKPFTPPVTGGVKLYCSRQCGRRVANAKQRGTVPRPPVGPFDCATCGKRCVPGQNVAPHAAKFCGDPHCKRAWHSPSPGKYKARAPKPPSAPATKLRWVSCRECAVATVVNPRVGRPLGGWVKRRKRGWCCPDCPPGWPDNQTNVWTAGRCRRCGDPFLAHNSGNSPTHCTLRCAQRDAKDARRILSPDISRPRRYAVFERDGWRCQLCGGMTRKDQARLPGGKDYLPKAPTIDHIVPVSKGGTNDESNLQTAHWSCNSAKSDGTYNPAGEQLRLLAA